MCPMYSVLSCLSLDGDMQWVPCSHEEVLKEVYNYTDQECAQVCGCQGHMENTTKILYSEMIWKGDIVIADTEELEEMDASELNAKEVLTPMKGDNFMFPIVADGTVNLSGGDQVLTGRGTRKSSRRIIRVFTTTSRLIHFRELHLPSSRWTESQSVRAERRTHSQFQHDTFWRDQSNKYNLGCDAWAPHWRSLWISKETRKPRSFRSVDWIHTIHHVGRKNLQMGIHAPGERLTKRTTSRPDYLWPEIWKVISEATKRTTKVGKRRSKLDNVRRLWGICFIDPADAEFKKTLEKKKNAKKVGSSDAFARSGEERTRKLDTLLMLPRQNTHASLKPTNLRESVWKRFYMKIMKTTLQRKGINSLKWK